MESYLSSIDLSNNPKVTKIYCDTEEMTLYGVPAGATIINPYS